MALRATLLALALLLGSSHALAQEPEPAELAETPPQLQPEAKEIDFDFSGDLREGFQALARAFGVRAIFDEELPPRSLKISLRKVRFETAADLAGELTGTFWVLVDARTILVAANTPAKRQAYQPQIAKTLSLAGTTPEQFNEIQQTLKLLLEIRRITPNARTRTLTLRDTPARVELAERLLDSLLEATPEVEVDIELLELDLRRARELGIIPPERAQTISVAQGLSQLQSQFQNLLLTSALQTLNIPPFIVFGGGRTRYAATLPGATANLSLLTSLVRQARSLTLRAREGQTATFHVGDRVPVIFVSFQSIFLSQQQQQLIQQGLFRNAVPAVQYQDTGVRVSVTPHVHAGREVSLKLDFDVILPTGQSLNDVPVFSERSLEQVIRLKDGETALLGGIGSGSESRQLEGTPGLYPVLGNRSLQTEETELLLLVTPRLLRASPLDLSPPAPLYVGTEAYLRSR